MMAEIVSRQGAKIAKRSQKQTAVGQAANCHSSQSLSASQRGTLESMPLVVIVGSPNVGKSVLFHELTGIYAAVSNYPGTTVEVMRGRARLDGVEASVMDTPGMYSLLPITEEERVARRILLNEKPAIVVHVVEAKNLERMLPLTLQLLEAGLPVMLDVNLMDEAQALGIQVNLPNLRKSLSVPVSGTALAVGWGVQELRYTLTECLHAGASQPHPETQENGPVIYPQPVEDALGKIATLLEGKYQVSRRTLGLLLLQGDEEALTLAQVQDGERSTAIRKIITATQAQFNQSLVYVIARARRAAAGKVLADSLQNPEKQVPGFAARLSDAMVNPFSGLPILAVALALLYLFVGVFGAQTLVGWLENGLFDAYLNPWIDSVLARLIPWQVLRELFGGEFGVLTLGLRYSIGIILPIVGTFFIAFSIIEDSGYLPRLAMLIDRLFKQIGLNGRAVIPMVLGFGCDTMATITTRTLETRRERIISTLLLSLAIPCSAQLGVMMALLAVYPAMLVVWGLVIIGVFLLVGFLTARLLPGERPVFYMELPPLRLPRGRNVLVKTYTRMEWYLREVFPLFILASVVIWLGNLTGLFDLAVSALTPLVGWLGLPEEAAVAFLFGFFRRDYGAAGLYDMREAMNAAQVLVAVVTMTLFVPCIAQFAVTIKERGWKIAAGMAAFIFPFALLVGGALAAILRLMGYAL
jgi:ferrous iron transport protein B